MFTGVGKAISAVACDGAGNAVFLVLNFTFQEGKAIGLSLSSVSLSCACCGGGGGGGGTCCCIILDDLVTRACCETTIENQTLHGDTTGNYCRGTPPCLVSSTDCIKGFYGPGARFKNCQNSSATATPCLQIALIDLVNCNCRNVAGVDTCVADGTLRWDGTGSSPYTTPPGGGC